MSDEFDVMPFSYLCSNLSDKLDFLWIWVYRDLPFKLKIGMRRAISVDFDQYISFADISNLMIRRLFSCPKI